MRAARPHELGVRCSATVPRHGRSRGRSPTPPRIANSDTAAAAAAEQTCCSNEMRGSGEGWSPPAPRMYPASLRSVGRIWEAEMRGMNGNGNAEHSEREELDDEFSLGDGTADLDRKSTRLNCSHSQISYAVFCLKI